MKTVQYEYNEQWLSARKGKITGTRLGQITNCYDIPKADLAKALKALNIEFKSTMLKEDLQALLPKDVVARLEKKAKKKIAFYELVAERLAVDESEFDGYVPNETPMDRGTRLQKFAIDQFTKETGKEVDEKLVMWVREDNEAISVSPDGVISETEAIETKCLSSARHIEAYLTQSIPDEYEFQRLQYFIVNDKLQKLYFAFYDPRIPLKSFFYITVTREEVQSQIDEYLAYQKKVLSEVDEIVAELTNF